MKARIYLQRVFFLYKSSDFMLSSLFELLYFYPLNQSVLEKHFELFFNSSALFSYF